MSTDPKKQLTQWLPQAWGQAPAFKYAQQNFQWLQPKTVAQPMQSVVPTHQAAPTMISSTQTQFSKLAPIWAMNNIQGNEQIPYNKVETTWVTIPSNNFRGIAWVNLPTIGSQFWTPQGADQTQVNNMPQQIQQQIQQEVRTPVALPVNTIPDLIASIKKNPDATPADIQTYFPELQWNESTFPDLIASIQKHPDATEQDIRNYFPELYQPKESNIDVKGKNPLLRWVEALWWAIGWAFEWAYQWLVPWFADMIEGTKKIWADTNKWVAEKFNATLLWEVMFNYIWWAIGDIIGWMIVGAAQWFTTETEQQRISEKAGKKIAEFIDVAKTNPDVQAVAEAYNKLDPKEKQDLSDLTNYAINAANIIPFVSSSKYWVVESLKGTAVEANKAVLKWAFYTAAKAPNSVLWQLWQKYLWSTVFNRLKNRQFPITPDNINAWFKIAYKHVFGVDAPTSSMVPAAWATVWSTIWAEASVVGATETVWAVSKAKDWIKAQKAELDPSTIKAVQSNPYVAKLWGDTMAEIETTGTPPDLNQLLVQPLRDLWIDLTDAIEAEKSRLSESWPIYEEIKQDTTPIDITPAQTQARSILSSNDISIGADGKLNFDKSSLTVPADMTAIQKIYDRLMTADTFTVKDVLNLRTFASDLTKWDQWWTSKGSYIVKSLRRAVDDVAKGQINQLAALDKTYRTQLKEIEKIQEWLFYREARRRWELRDNFMSILKNIGWQNRANMLARLEAIMPDLWARAEAINMLPKLAKAYTTPSKLSKTAWARVGWFAAWFWIGWRLWGIIGEKVVGIIGDKVFDGMKKSAIKAIVDKITPEAKAKLQAINAKIEAKKQLTAKEKAEVTKIREEVKRANAENLKTAADKAELARQDKAFKDFLDQGDTKGMWLPDSWPVNPVNTTIVGWPTIRVAPTGESARVGQTLEIGKGKEPKNEVKKSEPKQEVKPTKSKPLVKKEEVKKNEVKPQVEPTTTETIVEKPAPWSFEERNADYRMRKALGEEANKITNIEDAVNTITTEIPDSWMHNWFREGNEVFKQRLADLIISNPKIKEAGLRVMYENYHQLVDSPLGYKEFLETPITMYRWWQPWKVFTSYSFDKKAAGKFGEVTTAEIKPIDTLWSYQTTVEWEVLVPNEKVVQPLAPKTEVAKKPITPKKGGLQEKWATQEMTKIDYKGVEKYMEKIHNWWYIRSATDLPEAVDMLNKAVDYSKEWLAKNENMTKEQLQKELARPRVYTIAQENNKIGNPEYEKFWNHLQDTIQEHKDTIARGKYTEEKLLNEAKNDPDTQQYIKDTKELMTKIDNFKDISDLEGIWFVKKQNRFWDSYEWDIDETHYVVQKRTYWEDRGDYSIAIWGTDRGSWRYEWAYNVSASNIKQVGWLLKGMSAEEARALDRTNEWRPNEPKKLSVRDIMTDIDNYSVDMGELAQKEWLPVKWEIIKKTELADLTPKTRAIIEWEAKRMTAQEFMDKAWIKLLKHNKKWSKAYFNPNDGNIYLLSKYHKLLDLPENQSTLWHEIWHWMDRARNYWWRKWGGNLYATMTHWDYSTAARAELQKFQDYIQSDREPFKDTVIHNGQEKTWEEFMASDSPSAKDPKFIKMYQNALQKRELVKEYLRQDLELFADGIAKYMRDPEKMRSENAFIANIFENAIYSHPKVAEIIGKEWVSNKLRRSLQAVADYEFLVERMKQWTRNGNQLSDHWNHGELFNKDTFDLATLKSYLERNAKGMWLRGKSEKRILWWNSMDNGDMIKLRIGTR